MSITENEQKILDYINKQTYGQAVIWIADRFSLSYEVAKDICARLYSLGLIGKQGNGRFKAKGV